MAQIWPGIFIVTHKQWHGSVSFLYSHFTCRFSSMHITVSSYCKMMFTDVNKKVRQHCLIKFGMEDGSKPSVIHGRLKEYNMNIIQCQNRSARVMCCIQGQLWHIQQSPSWSVTPTTISLMVCATVNNLPWGSVPQSAISLLVCTSQQSPLGVCATVSNLPHGLCQSAISLMVRATVSSLPQGLC